MKQTRADFKSIIFLFLMIIFISVMIVLIIFLIHNKDVILQDPITYGMKEHNFTSCSCMDSKGITWTSTENGFVTDQNYLIK